MDKSKKDHLIDTALHLFLKEGFHATGIDRILKEAGVAKMTLYNHFKSKEELVLAALQRRDERFFEWLVGRTEQSAPPGRDRLLALFDCLEEWFRQDDFYGCMFINAAAEYLHSAEPPHVLAKQHKLKIREFIHREVSATQTRHADTLTDGLMLLSEGAIVMAHICNQPEAAQAAKSAARALCDAYL